MSPNVHEYAKPRRCFQYKFLSSDKPILALQTPNFNRAVWVKEIVIPLKIIKIIIIS
jgi:hypothetical protein